jgi:hypothetical protein
MLLRGVGSTWLQSLLTWRSIWMSKPSPLHCPTTCIHQTRRHSFLLGDALSHRTIVGGGTFSRDAKPQGLDIQWSADRLGTYVTKSYMEYINFTRICLSYIRVIMMFMRVSMVELLRQIVMGRIPALDCMLSGARGILWPHPISLGNKCYHLSRPRCW